MSKTLFNRVALRNFSASQATTRCIFKLTSELTVLCKSVLLHGVVTCIAEVLFHSSRHAAKYSVSFFAPCFFGGFFFFKQLNLLPDSVAREEELAV